MSKTLIIPLIAITIRRDAMTITPVTVPPYECMVLRNIFGKENVTGDEQVGTVEIAPEVEYERLSAKYGPEVVAKVYGEDEGARLEELVEKAAIEPAAADTGEAATTGKGKGGKAAAADTGDAK